MKEISSFIVEKGTPGFTFGTKEKKMGIKGSISAELNAGQMVEDVRLAVNGKVRVEHFGRLGGIVPTPDEVLNALKEKLM